jgi:integrase
VFWSDTTQKNPISSSFITLDFNKTVADLLEEQNNCVGEMVEVSTRKLGEKKSITKGEFLRRERNIVFHSLRHYYVTFMRGKVGDNLLQSVVGHQSTAMTNNYTHETEERLLEVGRVSCNILPSP